VTCKIVKTDVEIANAPTKAAETPIPEVEIAIPNVKTEFAVLKIFSTIGYFAEKSPSESAAQLVVPKLTDVIRECSFHIEFLACSDGISVARTKSTATIPTTTLEFAMTPVPELDENIDNPTIRIEKNIDKIAMSFTLGAIFPRRFEKSRNPRTQTQITPEENVKKTRMSESPETIAESTECFAFAYAEVLKLARKTAIGIKLNLVPVELQVVSAYMPLLARILPAERKSADLYEA
jgi:hypothetical protein